MTTVMIVVGIWVAAQLPLGILVGRLLNRRPRRPVEHLTQPAPAPRIPAGVAVALAATAATPK